MREELDKKLCEKYPDIFRDRNAPMTRTAMCWGFSHNDGWFTILDETCAKLMMIKKLTGVGVVATQVKEKFGTARFYIMGDEQSQSTFSEDDAKIIGGIIRDIIDYFESRSAGTCEDCGQWGSLRIWGNWYYTRCYQCWRKIMKDQYRLDIPEKESDYEDWENKRLNELTANNDKPAGVTVPEEASEV